MSNLKKVTALSLALVSVLGTIASATFADQSDIDATDAVDTLSALGIINGYTDGTFRPEGTVTRAEMAKMIFTIKNGGNDDASAFAGISSSFTDIKGHWAEGYIKYCQTQGIIAGKSATTFAPDQKVTGTEALKMALTVLGYRADKSGLTGSAWATNTLALASERGLTADYGQSFSAASQRQNAAQVLYNALYADVVKYSAMFDEYEIQDKMLAEKDMNLETKTAVLGEGKTIRVTVDGNTVEVKLNKDSSAYIGQEVEVLFNKTKKQAYGVKPTDNNKVIKAVASDLTLDDAAKTVKNDDVTITLGTTDYDAVDKAAASSFVTVTARKDGTAVTVYIEPVVVKEVTSVNSTRVIAGSSYTFEDNTIPAGIKVGNVVTITKDRYVAGTAKKLTVLEKMTGEVTGTKAGEVRIGTTWYKDGDSSLEIGDTVTYYVVNGTIYNVVADVTASNDYLLVTASEANSISNKAKVTLADGTEKTIDVKGNTKAAEGLHSYTVKDGVYTLTAVKQVAGTVSFNAKTDLLNGKEILDDAVIFVKAGTADVKVLTGKTVASWSKDVTGITASIVTKKVNGNDAISAAYLVLAAGATIPDTTSSSFYGLVTDTKYETKVNDETVTAVEIFNGTETVEYYTSDADVIKEIPAKGKYVTFEVGSNGKTLAKIDETNGTVYAVTGIGTKSLSVVAHDAAANATATTFAITDDTKVVYVDSKDTKGIETGSIQRANMIDDKYVGNVRIVVDSTNKDEIAVIFVDVNNEMAAITTNTYTVTLGANITAKIGSTSIASGDKVDKNTVVTVTYTAPTAPSSGETVKINGVAAAGEVNGTNTVFTADVTITANTTITATVAS